MVVPAGRGLAHTDSWVAGQSPCPANLAPAPDHIRGWLRQLPGPFAVPYEAGPTGFGLYPALIAAGIRCGNPRETHGYAKQGVGYGYTGVEEVDALIGTVSRPVAAPVIAATRLRSGRRTRPAAPRLVADALATARRAGATGLVIVRADSAFYGHALAAAARRAGARFSVTARMTPTVSAAIASIPEDAWTAIRYPNEVWDEDEGRLVSDARST